eukprot:3751682-Rhodomonas_salina.2
MHLRGAAGAREQKSKDTGAMLAKQFFWGGAWRWCCAARGLAMHCAVPRGCVGKSHLVVVFGFVGGGVVVGVVAAAAAAAAVLER